MKDLRKQTKLGKYFYLFPIAIMIAMIIFVLIYRKSITAENILHYTPKNPLLAAIVIVGLFVLKGLSVMFPGTVLYVASGMIFPTTWLAMAVSIAGTFAEIAVTYYMGRLCGEIKLISKLQKKEKFRKLFSSGHKNEGMLVYLSRIIGLPYDVMGMFWGAVGAKTVPYIIYSMLGKLPKVVIETYLGRAVDAKITKSMIITFAVMVAATLVITVVSNKIAKRQPD